MSHEVFKKSADERELLKLMKKTNKQNRKEQYGDNYKKYLNSDKDNDSVRKEH